MSDVLLLTDRTVKQCPRCEDNEIPVNASICDDCEEEIREDAPPDGQWCFSRDAGCWVYE